MGEEREWRLDGADEGSQSKGQWFGFEEEVDDIAVARELPVLPLRGVAVFPSAVVPLLISRDSSLALVEEALLGDRVIALNAQRAAEIDDPGPSDVYPRGCAGRILKMLKYPDGSIRILVQGVRRLELGEFLQVKPYLRATVTLLQDRDDSGVEVAAMKTRALQSFARLVELTPYIPDELQVVAVNIRSPGKVADLIAANLNLPVEEKQAILETLEVRPRLTQLTSILEREVELLELGQQIHGQVQSELHRNQKEFYLRQQLKAIRKELGESEGLSSETEMLAQRIFEARLPEEARKVAEAELDRLALIPPESAEHSVVRTYVEWLADIPWSVTTQDNLEIAHAKGILDEDHYGLEKIKERILEFLAVRQLRSHSRGPILCFAGPPGVGKTSLGRSIARAMGRKFHRVSLGGVRDEAEIRGHRRTYVGSMPGRVVQALKLAGSINPVFMLDEIDKMGSDVRGDPSSALLEVLDPEQNNSFRDHYLDVPLDLSKVLFLTTANYLDPIPPALRDRMEVLELSGYCEEEKLEIARRHLVPKQIEENGLNPKMLGFSDEAILAIVRDYTREAGLRNLERELGAVCRKVARAVTEGRKEPVSVTDETLSGYLGAARFTAEIADGQQRPGVAVGLAWTPLGGEILFVEASLMEGKKGLSLTGQLGDVMKESAQAALSFLRSNAERYSLRSDFFERSDLHIHVPSGAIPKDGPSAGCTMLAAMASVLTARTLREGLAMTGEITLRGAILPVGGIKEKVLAARRAGIRTVVIPQRNAKDVGEIEEHLKHGLEFRYVDSMHDLLDFVLETPRRENMLSGAGRA